MFCVYFLLYRKPRTAFNMPQDIGPTLRRLPRPKTHTGVISHDGRVKSSDTQRTMEEGEQHIELLEYEWPDLPPIRDLKDAVTRQRVSRGITFILPVDKGKNSIDHRFRTDLRAMFQEPYATEKPGYDERKVTTSAKLHFQTNTVDTKWTRKHSEEVPVKVNSEAERIRKLYAHSAPAGGRSKVGVTKANTRTRSTLILPLKAKANPESMKLRKEVEKIIKSVQEDNDEYDEENDVEGPYDVDQKNVRKSIYQFSQSALPATDHFEKMRQNILTAAGFSSYEELRNVKPQKLVIPDQFKSEYLSPEKNQGIWDWLHYGEVMTDFQYFLTICG